MLLAVVPDDYRSVSRQIAVHRRRVVDVSVWI